MVSRNLQILYWRQDTDKLPFETGVQRVTRRLAEKLMECGFNVVPIGWDDRARQVIALRTRSALSIRPLDSTAASESILFVPEIPFSLVAEDLDPVQLGRAYGLRTAALIHDLIPIKLAADYSPEWIAAFRRYVRQFASADLVFATTRYVAEDLRSYLKQEHLRVPQIEVVPLPAEFPSAPRVLEVLPHRTSQDTLRLVTVTTWEPRKNILSLLRAFGAVNSNLPGRLSLELVGRPGGTSYDEEVVKIARGLSTVTVRGALSDIDLLSLYATSHASIYPSIEEGFGMPIGESLWLGRPCLCHNGSSMAEIAPGGGTELVDMTDEGAIAEVLTRWTACPDEIGRLSLEAIRRPLRTWLSLAVDISNYLKA